MWVVLVTLAAPTPISSPSPRLDSSPIPLAHSTVDILDIPSPPCQIYEALLSWGTTFCLDEESLTNSNLIDFNTPYVDDFCNLVVHYHSRTPPVFEAREVGMADAEYRKMMNNKGVQSQRYNQAKKDAEELKTIMEIEDRSL